MLMGLGVRGDDARMTPGIHGLLLKMLKNWPLCALREDELRFLHLSLTKLLTLSVNFYLWREAVINTGNRTNRVLARKVPDEYWYLLYRALARVGFPAEALRPGNRSRSLCLFLHDRPDVTGAVCACVWAQLGLRRAPDLSQVTLADGNLLFNLGSVLPNRLVVGVLYCLVHWGADEHETRVRARLRPLFVAFLCLAGYLLLDRAILSDAHDYEGLWHAVALSMAAWHGLTPLPEKRDEKEAKPPCDDFIYLFANDPLQCEELAQLGATGEAR